MLVAKQKRNENIAGYLLYLYQIEDLIRTFNLDMNLIHEHLVKQYRAEESEEKEIAGWYENLVVMMQKEGKQKTGHLQFLANLLNDLEEFHIHLMEQEVDLTYVQIFKTVAGLVTELNSKNPTTNTPVRTAIDGLYGYLLLKMQKKTISPETTQAITSLGNWLDHLAMLFKKYESGDLEL